MLKLKIFVTSLMHNIHIDRTIYNKNNKIRLSIVIAAVPIVIIVTSSTVITIHFTTTSIRRSWARSGARRAWWPVEQYINSLTLKTNQTRLQEHRSKKIEKVIPTCHFYLYSVILSENATSIWRQTITTLRFKNKGTMICTFYSNFIKNAFNLNQILSGSFAVEKA